ncbi:hypothetical protein [Rhodococcus koreensis]|uniref:hypothetical protein n=1 Tax=Rhodococcus koreensis TaxID=99653 RepID=UPI00197FE89D|nr:hypothetical protein [Rhodococcus koreensis]QSE80799.1 hypothetical protein JWS14_17400 [Rhodococcus koreensis]
MTMTEWNIGAPLPPVAGGGPTRSKAELNRQVRRYATERRRDIRRRRIRPSIDRQARARESSDIIALARIWIPYGGVPAELIFERFGIVEHDFLERLWKAAETTGCASDLVRELSSVYPRHTKPDD